MVRHTHGTVVRLLSTSLLALAACVIAWSSLVFQPSNFDHPTPASTSQHAPVHEVIEALVRVGPTFVVAAPVLTPARETDLDEIGAVAVRPFVQAQTQRTSRAVLRL
jgi:hypothetical protein